MKNKIMEKNLKTQLLVKEVDFKRKFDHMDEG